MQRHQERRKPNPVVIRQRLHAARLAKLRHEQECVIWDYESDNGCLDCAETAQLVRQLRAQLRKALPAET